MSLFKAFPRDPFDSMRNMNRREYAYSSSTVTSIESRNGGEPRIIQTTSEVLRGPEGFERTRKGHRDTEKNIEKVEVEHRLGERGYKILKERDPLTGKISENQEFNHIENEEEFENEWRNLAEKYRLKDTFDVPPPPSLTSRSS